MKTGSVHLTYDEAALFNSLQIPAKRKFVDTLLRSSKYYERGEDDCQELAQSLLYKLRYLSSEEYKELYQKIPLQCGF